jgi:hypothetical protein
MRVLERLGTVLHENVRFALPSEIDWFIMI